MKVKKRNYKEEYKKFQSGGKRKKYRAALNRFNRKKGTYGNGDGLDASHKAVRSLVLKKRGIIVGERRSPD